MPNKIKYIRLFLICTAIVIIAFGTDAIGGEDSTSQPFSITIGSVDNALPGETISIPVVKTGGSEGISGFDFLIGYDHAATTITGIIPGVVFDIPGDYEWEWWTHRIDPIDNPGSLDLTHRLRVVALAETNNGAHHPVTIEVPDGTVLFTIECQVDSGMQYSSLLSFLWLDCGDNAIALADGSSLALSYHVYDFEGMDITDTLFGFPGQYGAPASCFENAENPPVQYIDFYNGGTVASEDSTSQPFSITIGSVDNALPGETISIPVVKTGGSEGISGFDFLIGYDHATLTITGMTPGVIFDIPGDYEWEWSEYRLDPIDNPGSLDLTHRLRVVALAETNNGAHHPVTIEVPDGTVLFTIECQVDSGMQYSSLLSFLWLDCGDNAIALADGSSLALSYHVYDFEGMDITDTLFGFPGQYGAPASCFENAENPPVQYIDFYNGGVGTGASEDLRLAVSIESTTANMGDTAIYLDVLMSNPQDTVVGFSLFLQLDRSDIVEFGMSASDTIAVDVENTLIEDWEFLTYHSMSETHHDIKIVAISNITASFTKGISPQENGVLLRLILHTSDVIPNDTLDWDVRIFVNDDPSMTSFSDANGILLGYYNQQYNPSSVVFEEGHITILNSIGGDANSDGKVNIGDAIYLLNFIFKGGSQPEPICRGDSNCDDNCNVGDVVKIINYIFKNGDRPCSNCGQ